MSWTDGVDRAAGYIVPASIWNGLLGATGSLMYLKTKYMWYPASCAFYNGAYTFLSAEGGLTNAANDYVICYFRIPDDFVSLSEAKLAVIAGTTDAAEDWNIYAQYAKTGETLTTHTANNTATTYNGTADKYLDVDVSGILTSLSAGDTGWVKILVGTAADIFACKGLYIEYLSGT